MAISLRKISAAVILAAALGRAVYHSAIALQLHGQVRNSRETLEQLEVAARHAQLAAKNAQRRLGQSAALPVAASPQFVPGSDAALGFEITEWLRRVSAIRHAAKDRPELSIPEMRLLTDEDWIQAAQGFSSFTQTVSTDGVETTVDFEPNLATLREKARRAFMAEFSHGLEKYRLDHADALPESFADLAPLLPAIDAAMLARYDIAVEKNRFSAAEKPEAAVDQESLAIFELAHTGKAWREYRDFETPLVRNVREALARYAVASGGAPVSAPEQLAPYLPKPMTSAQLTESYARLPEVFRRDVFQPEP